MMIIIKYFLLNICALIIFEIGCSASGFEGHEFKSNVKHFVGLPDENATSSDGLRLINITIGDLLALQLGKDQRSFELSSSRTERSKIISNKDFGSDEAKDDTDKLKVSLLEPISDPVTALVNSDERNNEVETQEFVTMEEKLSNSELQKDITKENLEKIRSMETKGWS